MPTIMIEVIRVPDKNYYWIKLQSDWFKTPAVKLLRTMAGGDTYAIIYLELILLSLENNGYIYFTGIGDNFSQEIALVLNEKEVDVEALMAYLISKKLIEYSDDNAFKFADDVTEGLIGKESSSAKRVRAYRNRQKQLALQSNNDVTNRNTELEKELEIDKDKREKHSTANAEHFDWKAVIDYLNQKAGKHFKHTDANKRLIIARYRDGGFTVNDMKKVIDNQCASWLNSSEMNQYLRPATLFRASKFEGYLNNQSADNNKPQTRKDWFG